MSYYETNLPKANSYFRVIESFEVLGVAGHKASNTWIGSSQVLDPVYERLTLKPGDEIHNLYGGEFALHNGKVWKIVLKEDPKHIFEKRYLPDHHTWPLDSLQQITKTEARVVRYATNGHPIDQPLPITEIVK
jgi:hypothetical protein